MTARPSSGALPPLADGDVYVYLHGNGAIFVRYGDGRSMLVPLDELLSVATGCHAAGHRVVAAWDSTPIALDVVQRLRAAGLPVVEADVTQPPHTWNEGTDALIEAAAVGTDHLLDDLIARGADIHHQDDSGSTALHHAAANGNLHAVDALVAAGADRDLVNRQGFTPHMLAMACRQQEAAQRLETVGADPSPGATTAVSTVSFSGSHYGTVYVWLVPLVLVGALIGFLWPLNLVGWLGVAAYVVAYGVVVPPLAFWAGGVPRRLDGTSLTLRRVTGSTRTVDLADVTLAGAGGSVSRMTFMGARWLLLAHPEGHPVSRRTLRRLLVPSGELDAFAQRADRVIVVPLDGKNRDEVMVPVGNALSVRGVDLSASLRAQLARARQDARRG